MNFCNMFERKSSTRRSFLVCVDTAVKNGERIYNKSTKRIWNFITAAVDKKPCLMESMTPSRTREDLKKGAKSCQRSRCKMKLQ